MYKSAILVAMNALSVKFHGGPASAPERACNGACLTRGGCPPTGRDSSAGGGGVAEVRGTFALSPPCLAGGIIPGGHGGHVQISPRATLLFQFL